MFVVDFLDDSLGVQAPAILVRMDLNYDESHTGSLRVHSLVVFVTEFSTIVSDSCPGHSWTE